MPTGVYERVVTRPRCHPDRKHKADGMCRKCYNEAYRIVHPEKRQDKSWQRLYDLYGLTQEQYKKLLELQNGGCAICGSENAYHSNNGKLLIVDHDHETGHVRGLLCSKCNKALGLFNDDSDLIEKALDYVGG